MTKYIIKRILWMIPVLLGITIMIFSIMYLAPGDVTSAIIGADATAAQRAELRAELGLDLPYVAQLWNYIKQVFLHFSLGNSYVTGESVMSAILGRMPYTLIIGSVSIVVQVLVGTPLGIYAATHQNKMGDTVATFIAMAGVAIPQFWLALMLVLLFAVKLGWLPPLGISGWECFILPCIANSFSGIAMQTRQTRSSMLEVIRSDYITTARAKGVSERDILLKHALPNGLIPLITIIGSSFGMMFSGSLVIENVFSIPGIGTYMTNGINTRDRPVVIGSVIVLGMIFAFIMLIVDIIYAFIDPRIKAQYTSKKKGKRHE